jgi:preprotein translocase subunit SecB
MKETAITHTGLDSTDFSVTLEEGGMFIVRVLLEKHTQVTQGYRCPRVPYCV